MLFWILVVLGLISFFTFHLRAKAGLRWRIRPLLESLSEYSSLERAAGVPYGKAKAADSQS